MKVIIKNLKQVTFEIEVPSAQSTVLDLKMAIEKEKNLDHEQLKLLCLGVILDDAKKLEDYKIEEGSTIILMMSKVKVKNNDQKPPEQSANPKKKTKKKKKRKSQKNLKKINMRLKSHL